MGLLKRPWRSNKGAPCSRTADTSRHSAPSARQGMSSMVLVCWFLLLSISHVVTASDALSSKTAAPQEGPIEGSAWRRRHGGYDVWRQNREDGAVHPDTKAGVVPLIVPLGVENVEAAPQTHHRLEGFTVPQSHLDQSTLHSDTLKHTATLFAHSVQKKISQEQHSFMLHGNLSGVLPNNGPNPTNSNPPVVKSSVTSDFFDVGSRNDGFILHNEGTSAVASDLGSIFNSSVLLNFNSRENSLPHGPLKRLEDTPVRRVRRVPQGKLLLDENDPSSSINLTASGSSGGSVTSHHGTSSTTRSSRTGTNGNLSNTSPRTDSQYLHPEYGRYRTGTNGNLSSPTPRTDSQHRHPEYGRYRTGTNGNLGSTSPRTDSQHRHPEYGRYRGKRGLIFGVKNHQLLERTKRSRPTDQKYFLRSLVGHILNKNQNSYVVYLIHHPVVSTQRSLACAVYLIYDPVVSTQTAPVYLKVFHGSSCRNRIFKVLSIFKDRYVHTAGTKISGLLLGYQLNISELMGEIKMVESLLDTCLAFVLSRRFQIKGFHIFLGNNFKFLLNDSTMSAINRCRGSIHIPTSNLQVLFFLYKHRTASNADCASDSALYKLVSILCSRRPNVSTHLAPCITVYFDSQHSVYVASSLFFPRYVVQRSKSLSASLSLLPATAGKTSFITRLVLTSYFRRRTVVPCPVSYTYLLRKALGLTCSFPNVELLKKESLLIHLASPSSIFCLPCPFVEQLPSTSQTFTFYTESVHSKLPPEHSTKCFFQPNPIDRKVRLRNSFPFNVFNTKAQPLSPHPFHISDTNVKLHVIQLTLPNPSIEATFLRELTEPNQSRGYPKSSVPAQSSEGGVIVQEPTMIHLPPGHGFRGFPGYVSHPLLRNVSRPSLRHVSSPSLRHVSSPSLRHVSSPSLRHVSSPSLPHVPGPSAGRVSRSLLGHVSRPWPRHVSRRLLFTQSSGDKLAADLLGRDASHAADALNCSSYPGGGHDAEAGVHLVTLRWKEVGVYFTITAFVIFAGLGKLGFHQLHWLSSKVPESCLLIVLGLIMGLILFFTAHETDPSATCHHHIEFPTFTSEAFFLVLLPPIILESAYSLHDRAFIDNLGTVLVFAVFGTLMNVFIIGPALFGLAAAGAMGNFNITLTESLVFSSLISAVDPVAVLNIFQDLGVNKGLYFLVFGESLLNDGVTVVVYNTLSVFMKMTTVKVTDYVLSVVAFFVVALCGALIGLVYGFITALVTRVTTTVRVVEPLALLGFAYLAYLSAEMFHFSGIISLIVCGLVQAHYAFQNISGKSYTCVKYFTKMASATSETIIFMFLGMVLVSEDHAWHTGFVLWTLALCFVARFLITLGLSAVTNRYRTHAIGMSEQLILAYGGLRGAVAFSLVTMLPEDLALRGHFVTATLAVILFTVFIQGITIRPLVNWLDVSKRQSGRRQLLEEVHVNVVDHMMAGIEEVLGQHGDFYLREQMRFYNNKYLKRWFVRRTCEAPLKRLFEKIAITEHYAHLYGPAVLLQEQQLSGSRMKLVDASPYASKHTSVQCLMTASLEMPHDDMTLEEALPGALPGENVQLRSGKHPFTRRDTKLNLSPSNSVEADAKILRRAISSNPYNQLHYTYNRNLVNADNQEISDHLHRRREQARRLTRLASQSSMQQSTHTLTRSGETPPPPLLTNNNAWMSSNVTSAAPTTNTSSRGTAAAGTTAYPSGMGGRTVMTEVEDLEDGPRHPHESEDQPSGGGFAGSDRLARRDTITMTPEEMMQIRQTDQRRRVGWNPSRKFLNRMISLTGDSSKAQSEDLEDLPDADELAEDIRKVNDLIDCHRRRSAFRRSARRARTCSEGSEGEPWGGYDSRPPSSMGGGLSLLPSTPEIPESGQMISAPNFDDSTDNALARDPLLRPPGVGGRGARDRLGLARHAPTEEGRKSPSGSPQPSSQDEDTKDSSV